MTMNANQYIYQKIRALDQDPFRPDQHFTAPVGWINDPNGLIYFKGWYHLFCQYNPYGAHWDTMHWYHARSKDLKHWEDLGVALEPDQDYERKGGVFSGSAIVKDDRLYLLYTAHHIASDGTIDETQCLAYSDDGLNFEKYPENPILTAADGPAGLAKADFRDPKVFEHGGSYYLVVAGAVNGHGQVLLFKSADLVKWEYVSAILKDQPYMGRMTECPDYFEIDGQAFLAFSTIHGDGHFSTVNIVKGEMDWESGEMTPLDQQLFDAGPDFYASQSFTDKDGQRIMIPWLRSVDQADYLADTGHNWNGMMGLPRRLSLLDGQLVQSPVTEWKEFGPEVENGSYQLPDFKPGKKLSLIGINGRIEISRLPDRYQVAVVSPIYQRSYQLPAAGDDLSLNFDNSCLELFAQKQTLSLFTFIYGIKQAIWE